MVAISPVWPPASVPWATISSTPACMWRAACSALPHMAPIITPRARRSSTTSGGGEPSALTTSFTCACASATASSRRAPSGVMPPRPCTISRSMRSFSSWRQRRNLRLAQDVLHEVAMRLRDQLVQVFARLLGLRVVVGGDDHVHAVGPAVDMLVDPAQFGLELLRREGGSAQHAEAAGLGHFHHHVAAVREGEDRQLASELLAEGCLHVQYRRGLRRVRVRVITMRCRAS